MGPPQLFSAVLLHLIAQKPDHGYGIMDRMEAVCGEVMTAGTNRIYPALQRLEEQGLILGRWDHPSKRMRRIYSMTPHGFDELAKMEQQLHPLLDSFVASAGALHDLLYQDIHALRAGTSVPMNPKDQEAAPSSTTLEQKKEADPKAAKEGDAPLDDYDKTVADSFPASDPPAGP